MEKEIGLRRGGEVGEKVNVPDRSYLEELTESLVPGGRMGDMVERVEDLRSNVLVQYSTAWYLRLGEECG